MCQLSYQTRSSRWELEDLATYNVRDILEVRESPQRLTHREHWGMGKTMHSTYQRVATGHLWYTVRANLLIISQEKYGLKSGGGGAHL